MGQIVLETDGSGTVIDRYMRGAGGRLIRSDRHGWYLHDRQGSVVQRTSNQGVVLHSYRFTAFGNELIAPNGVESGNPFRFQSMYWDSHTQTYYTPNRHYNPRTGRWLSPDPHWDIRTNAIFGDSPTIRNDRNVPSIHAILQAGNLYAFVMHNPVRWLDPLGLFAEDKNPADKKIEDATHGALAPRDPRTRRVFRLGSGRGTSGGGRSNASGGGNTTGGRVSVQTRISNARDSGRALVGRITGRGNATNNQAPIVQQPTLPANARTTTDSSYIFNRLEHYHGIPSHIASDRLHIIKLESGRGGADNVLFDMTGNVYDPVSRDFLGSLTSP